VGVADVEYVVTARTRRANDLAAKNFIFEDLMKRWDNG
jgi:hypothetical protein